MIPWVQCYCKGQEEGGEDDALEEYRKEPSKIILHEDFISKSGVSKL